MNACDHLPSEPFTAAATPKPALICLSHLRWDFVTQRPQHLMDRFARDRRVLFWEEAIPTTHHLPYLEFHAFEGTTVQAIRPRVPDRWSPEDQMAALTRLFGQMLSLTGTARPVLWLYTPMLWPVVQHVDAAAVVFDCMDELSSFHFAPPSLVHHEAALMAAADLVTTGGWSLWEAKRSAHANIHVFPSSVDTAHFAAARTPLPLPADQAGLPGPRLGWYGVIDERLDLGLIAALAAARPDWSIVMIGPVVKIDPASLPQAPNLHWLGQKHYDQLPAYLAGWDVALMPFAINEATRFISPTKTPEYLAAGCPVVSTPVCDVVRQYGQMQAVHIADGAPAFVAACARALSQRKSAGAPFMQVDEVLAQQSWDLTQQRMSVLVDQAVTRRQVAAPSRARHAQPRPDVTVCGAGFAGAVMARQLAEKSGRRVLIVDRRDHIGGNAFDELNADGLLIHRYGPHVFHTNAAEVVDFLSRFTEWRPYEHRVLADLGDRRVPVPINRTTLNMLYDAGLSGDADTAAFLAARARPVDPIRTARDTVVSAVGDDLYRLVFEDYSRKQWGLDLSQLDRSVTARLQSRIGTDDRYYTDRFQAMPRDGYAAMFARLLDHPLIEVRTSTDFHDLGTADRGDLTVYTGPIDAYFGHRLGALPYRSLTFAHETLPQQQFQPVGVVNYPAPDIPFTRITEHKHLTGQDHPMTAITREYPSDRGDPFYPVARSENHALFRRYQALADAEPGVVFAGRLASYRDYHMDQVVAQALALHRRLMQVSADA